MIAFGKASLTSAAAAFEEILASCGVAIAPELLRSMLSRFPRSPDGLVNYAAFLQ